MPSIALQERAFSDFASSVIDVVYSYGRRSTSNNVESSNIHIENQAKLNSKCISDTIMRGVKVIEKVHEEPQSGFLPYSRSYAKRLARSIRAKPKGSKVVIVVSSLGRLSREYRTIAGLQRDLRDYDVFIQFSSQKHEKPMYGIDYKVIRLADVVEADLAYYKEEVKARVNPLQEERTRIAIRLINLGIPAREAYKECGIWQGAIRAYQAKNPFDGRILKGARGRLHKTKKVIDAYYSEYRSYSVREIALKVGYSVRNVYYVIAKHREAMARLADIKARQALAKAKKSENNSAKVSDTSHKIDHERGRIDPIDHGREARDDDS